MDTVVHKIGRRKTSVARIYLKKEKATLLLIQKIGKIIFQLQLINSK